MLKKTYKKKNHSRKIKKYNKNKTKNKRRRSKKYVGGITPEDVSESAVTCFENQKDANFTPSPELENIISNMLYENEYDSNIVSHEDITQGNIKNILDWGITSYKSWALNEKNNNH